MSVIIAEVFAEKQQLIRESPDVLIYLLENPWIGSGNREIKSERAILAAPPLQILFQIPFIAI